VDFVIRTTTYLSEDMTWLGSAHGTNTADTITLDLSLFTAGTHFPNGFIPAGMTLAKVTASGAYGPYNNALSNGQEVMKGHLYKPVNVPTDNVAGKAMGALYWHGEVVEAKLPTNSGIDSAGKVDLAGQIKYV
jgi:hypothetical protein